MEKNEISPLLPRPSLENSRNSGSKCSIPCRYSLAIMISLGFCTVYGMRVNLSVALVAMVNSTDNSINTDFHNPECQGEGGCNKTVTRTARKHEEFNWDEKTQVTQLPGGWLASRYGGKHLFGLGVLCTSVFTLLTPIAAHHSLGSLIALRVLEGIGEGVTFPATIEMWSSWAPPLERSRLTAISFAGCGIGNIITQPIAGWLCDTYFLAGWPSVFYIFGALGILWYIAWLFLVYDKPASHPRISEEEKEYILSSIGTSQDKTLKNHSVPWLAIFTSPAVYAVVMGYVCANWAFYVLLTGLPTYFRDALHVKILEDGFISSIPYITSVVLQLVAATLGDWLLSTGSRKVDVRKASTTCSLIVPACLLISVSYVGSDDKVLIVVLLSLTLGFGAFSSAGFGVNHLDIAPRYAGIIIGFANSLGTIPGFVAPFVTGWLTNGEPTRRQWQKVFYIAAIINIIGATGFAILAKGEEQPWNTANDENPLPVEVEQEQDNPGLAADEGYNGSRTSNNTSINTV
ncbi:sialin-like isoform X2 [Actinia tenebrosa]|uniref:Sialin n=1 Tax=Actinia tenebrosa TaxID=6105 RepID=A0A6P8HD46_ACTTE|nr:sialin-like isoform X2 [Actinia tenebrosa]